MLHLTKDHPSPEYITSECKIFFMNQQQLLPLTYTGNYEDDLVVGSCNGDVVSWLKRFPSWPFPFFYIHGPEKSGKSTFAKMFKRQTQGILVSKNHLLEGTPHHQAIIVDDAEDIPEETLFHLYNRATVSKKPLILFSKYTLSEFPVNTKDMRSRLYSFYTLELKDPDELTFRMLFLKELKSLGITLPLTIVEVFLMHGERSFSFLWNAVQFIHTQTLLLKRPITRAMVMEYVGREGGE